MLSFYDLIPAGRFGGVLIFTVSDLLIISSCASASFSTSITKDSSGTIWWLIIFVRMSLSIFETNIFTLRTNSLVFDVTEDPKPGQLKDLDEALDDELVEVKDTAIEVLERRESEVDDLILVKVD